MKESMYALTSSNRTFVIMKFDLAQKIFANSLSPILLVVVFTSGIVMQNIAYADDRSGAAPIHVGRAMDKARDLIAKGELKKATDQLNKVVTQDKRNADAWNLLGYSWRKLDKNKKSRTAYAKALKLDPQHKGALEYQGELFIKIGELDKANANLEKLKTLCPSGCQELENLEKALAGNSSY